MQVHRLPVGANWRATVTGLTSCGSVWACPVCSAHIRYVRSLDVAEGCTRHLEGGGGLLFVTLTLRHHKGEALADLLGGLLEAQRSTFRGAPWQRMVKRYGINGRIRATEVTYGEGNGWHPHGHLLLFTDEPLRPRQVRMFAGWLARRWADHVQAQGLQLPDLAHGCDVQLVADGDGVGQYVCKVQDANSVPMELTRADLKRSTGGLVPFELLDMASQGEAEFLRRWWDYERATRNRRCIEWSRGLRERLGIGAEIADADVVADDTTDADSLVAHLEAGHWRSVCASGLDAELLEACEADGLHGVLSVVARALSN